MRKHGDRRNNIEGLVSIDGMDDIGPGRESIMAKFKGFLGEVNAEDVKWLHVEDVKWLHVEDVKWLHAEDVICCKR